MEGSLSTGKHRTVEDDFPLPEKTRERRVLELDEALWRYLGSIPPSHATRGEETPIVISGTHHEHIAHLEDSDQRGGGECWRFCAEPVRYGR